MLISSKSARYTIKRKLLADNLRFFWRIWKKFSPFIVLTVFMYLCTEERQVIMAVCNKGYTGDFMKKVASATCKH